MHIPDGYLGPVTFAFMYAVMLPVWAVAARKAGCILRQRRAPLLALGAAFSFVIMMFNLPVPGGTTGHATGAVLVAILLGPWPACIAVSVAVIIQAIIFGDGGITAIAANCFNIAFVLVFSGYYSYRWIVGVSLPQSGRRMVAAAAAGYIGLNAAAFTTALQFGIQPLLHRTPAGQPLYSPYGLDSALTAMMGGHLFVFGWMEALVTAAVLRYLQKQYPELIAHTIEKNAGAR